MAPMLFRHPLPKGKPAGLKDSIYVDQSNKTEHKIYNTFVIVQHLLTIISPDSSWAKQLQTLINTYSVDTKRMDFPEGWETRPLWQQALN